MGEKRGFLPRWTTRPAPVGAEAPEAGLKPIPRAPTTPHHWLSILVARPGPHAPVPVGAARVVVRHYPRGADKPGDVAARGTTAPDGTVELLLPTGRYAVIAKAGQEGRNVTVTLEHAGRALVMLDDMGRRIVLTIEAARFDGKVLPEALVEVRAVPAGSFAAQAVTDERGVVVMALPPGAYEVKIGGTVVRTFAEADTLLRVTAESAAPAIPPAATKYAQKVRNATTYVASYDVAHVREDMYN